MSKPVKPVFTDVMGAHARLYRKIVNSPAWRALSKTARALYVDLRVDLLATNNGNISATMSILKHKGWNSPGTLSNALYELRALGLIDVTRAGGVQYGSKVCNLYRFTDQECFEHPKLGIPAMKATHDYAKYESYASAKEALKSGKAALRNAGVEKRRKAIERKKTTLQEAKRFDTNDEAEGINSRYETRRSATHDDMNFEVGIAAQKLDESRVNAGSEGEVSFVTG